MRTSSHRTGMLIVILSLSLLGLWSCGGQSRLSRAPLYFHTGLDSIAKIQTNDPVIKVFDEVSVRINSKSSNQDQVKVFNTAATNVNGATVYIVNNEGNLDVPMIGNVKATGLTRLQLQALLTDKVAAFVKDPVVTVNFNRFEVNVLGEVRSPGTKNFNKDHVTLIDVIGAAGGIADEGRKDNVMVIREGNGQRSYYRVDFGSGGVFQSPVYVIQPNDIVYVEPNKFKLKQISSNPNRRENLRYYLALFSIGLTVTSLILAIQRIR